jgi:hypothetical protein
MAQTSAAPGQGARPVSATASSGWAGTRRGSVSRTGRPRRGWPACRTTISRLTIGSSPRCGQPSQPERASAFAVCQRTICSSLRSSHWSSLATTSRSRLFLDPIEEPAIDARLGGEPGPAHACVLAEAHGVLVKEGVASPGCAPDCGFEPGGGHGWIGPVTTHAALDRHATGVTGDWQSPPITVPLRLGDSQAPAITDSAGIRVPAGTRAPRRSACVANPATGSPLTRWTRRDEADRTADHTAGPGSAHGKQRCGSVVASLARVRLHSADPSRDGLIGVRSLGLLPGSQPQPHRRRRDGGWTPRQCAPARPRAPGRIPPRPYSLAPGRP